MSTTVLWGRSSGEWPCKDLTQDVSGSRRKSGWKGVVIGWVIVSKIIERRKGTEGMKEWHKDVNGGFIWWTWVKDQGPRSRPFRYGSVYLVSLFGCSQSQVLTVEMKHYTSVSDFFTFPQYEISRKDIILPGTKSQYTTRFRSNKTSEST